MKTAVEQFYNAIIDQIALSDEHLEMIKSYKEQCKEMEKEQIINAHLDGQSLVSCKDEYAEHYYNETFKSE